MRVAVVGAHGMLGQDLVQSMVQAGHVVTGHDLPELDICAPASLRGHLAAVEPEIVINCAAYTDVDRAEAEPDRAQAINAEGAGHLAQATQALGSRLVQISTDYVFDGAHRQAYAEEDSTNPLGVYGQTKLAGERAVRAAAPESLIVRTQSLFGRQGKNFVEAILARAEQQQPLSVVADQISSPTYTRHLAQALVALCALPASTTSGQIVNVANRGACSWFDFAAEILQLSGLSVPLTPTTAAAFGRPAPRPAYSVLDTQRYKAWTGQAMPSWQEALQAYLAERRAARLGG